jgi:hypothetical protein
MARFFSVGPSYQAESPVQDLESLLNWILENSESSGAVSAAGYITRPYLAIRQKVEVTGPIRAMAVANGRGFIVSAGGLYEIFVGGTAQLLGAVQNDSKPAQMCASPTQLLVVSGGQAYGVNLNGGYFALIAAISLGGAASITSPITDIRISSTASGAIAAASWTGGTATITVDMSGLTTDYLACVRNNEPITVAGVGVGGYNGDFTITSVNKANPAAVVLTYAVAGPLANSAGGTVTVYTLAIAITPTVPWLAGNKVNILATGHAAFNLSGLVIASVVQSGPANCVLYTIPTLAIIHDGAVAATGTVGQLDGTTQATYNGAIQCAFTEGYFAVLFANSQFWGISALYDVTSWSAANQAKIEVFADNIVSMLLDDHANLIFWSSTLSVGYYLSGGLNGSTFPFDVIQGSQMAQGSAGVFGPAKADNTFFWLGLNSDGQLIAWRGNGFLPQRVSTFAEEQAWQGYAATNDVISMVFQWHGHAIVSWYFPTADATWAYDCSTQGWSQLTYWDGAVHHAWRAAYHAFVFGVHLFGDRSNASGGQLFTGTTDWTMSFETVRFERVMPAIGNELEWITFDELLLDVEGFPLLAAPTVTSQANGAALAAGTYQVRVFVYDAGANLVGVTQVQSITFGVTSQINVAFPVADRGLGSSYRIYYSPDNFVTAKYFADSVPVPASVQGINGGDPSGLPAAINPLLLTLGTATINVAWTDNAGTSWKPDAPRALDATQAGHKSARVVTFRLGRSRRRSFKIWTTDQVRVIDGYVQASGPGVAFRRQERLAKELGKRA